MKNKFNKLVTSVVVVATVAVAEVAAVALAVEEVATVALTEIAKAFATNQGLSKKLHGC